VESTCTTLGGEYVPGGGGPSDLCTDPNFPVDCGGGDCWSEGTDCSLPAFDCGGSLWRCREPSDWGSCCNGAFVTCSAQYPNYCPGDNMCYQSPTGCDTSTCTVLNASCDG
jgi:hypothetical protein